MKHMKRLSLLLALLILFASCAQSTKDAAEEAPETVPVSEAPVPAAPETEPPLSDYPKLTDHSWTIANSEAVGALTFKGGEAEFFLLADGESVSLSGPVSVGNKTLTIGDTEIGWAVVASFCKLTVGGIGYSFMKSDDPDAAMGPYNLLNNSWEGDCLTLSFDGGTARLSVEGGKTAVGSWELSAGKTLTILDDAKGDPANNLARGAKATSSSVETPDFPPELAVDGDFGTRFSSEYVDPSWLLLDLGEEKTVGAAVLYFETACSADFTFDVSSDGKTFTEAASVTGNSSAGIENPVTVLFGEPFRCRYVRFNGLSRATSWGHSFYELELYEYIPGSAECRLEYDGPRINLTLDGKVYVLSKK